MSLKRDNISTVDDIIQLADGKKDQVTKALFTFASHVSNIVLVLRNLETGKLDGRMVKCVQANDTLSVFSLEGPRLLVTLSRGISMQLLAVEFKDTSERWVFTEMFMGHRIGENGDPAILPMWISENETYWNALAGVYRLSAGDMARGR